MDLPQEEGKLCGPRNPKAMKGATKTATRKGKKEKKEYTCDKCVYTTNWKSNMMKHIREAEFQTGTIDLILQVH